MFSRKTRKLSVAVLILSIALLFGFCIISNCEAVDVNANDIEVNSIDIIYASSDITTYQVYENYPNEVFPALPSKAELWNFNGATGQIVDLTWNTDGNIIDDYVLNKKFLTYTASFELPIGYKLSAGFSAYPKIENVEVIYDARPAITSLNACTVIVPQNQKYTLPETLKGKVDDVDGLVDIAVTWNSVVETTENGAKVYTATAVNSFNYKIPDGTNITAKLTLTESPIKQHYKTNETFKSMAMDGYTFLGWANLDDASQGVFEAGTAVSLDGDYFAIFAKVEYLGVGFRIKEQGVRYGFALRICGLNNEETTDKLDVEFTNKLVAKILQKATFTATIYGQKYEYSYTNTKLKYGYIEKYKGYVANLVFEKISDSQLDESVKVDAKFEVASKTLSAEGKTCTIREKAQDAYDTKRFDITDQATIDKMVQMYGVKTNEG